MGHAHGPKAHDGTIATAAPDVMWGTDMTATVTVGEGAAFVFVAVDHCTTECIGLHAAKRGTRFEALEPIRQGVRARVGTIGEGVARGLRLRHDHGSNYLADDFQQEVAFFGIESSPSSVREPEGNGVAERFIRTLKENLLWVRSFDTIEELRLALLEFKRTYNEQWMLEKYHYQSPALLLANLGATIFDFVVRQKAHSTNLNWYIVEQLPVVPPDRYETIRFGSKTAGEIVRETVLELTYTAHDMAPFARDLGHLDEAGKVKPPFRWDEDRRLRLRAKLDAVFFHLYGVTDRDDIRYIYSTFPIVERQENDAYADYRSCHLCLAWINALAAGHPDAEIE